MRREGERVLMVDLDPQSNLTAMCVDEERMEELWVDDAMQRKSMRGAVQPIIDGVGDIQKAYVDELSPKLGLVPGDIRLSELEAKLSDAWPRCMDRDPASFRLVSSFHRVIQAAAKEHETQLVLIDVGPNLGAINRSAVIAADYVVTPLGADLFSIQGLRNLGPTLKRWREEWNERLAKNPVRGLPLPDGSIEAAGYVVMQPNLYGGQVTHAYARWLREVPSEYARSVLQETRPLDRTVESDPHCLAVLKHYRSLMPMAQTARKPIFKLTPADGALGGHFQAAQEVGAQFRALAQKIAERTKPSA